MLEVMTPPRLPNQKPDQNLGPGKITILNPKEKPQPVEPSLSQESPNPQSTANTPVENPKSYNSTPQMAAATPPLQPTAPTTTASTPVPVAQVPVLQRAIPAPVAPTNPSATHLVPQNGPESPDNLAAPIPHSSDHVCSNCGVTDTPLWRRGLRGEIMCNACGLYVKSRRISRPVNLKRSPRTKTVVQGEDNAPGTCPGGGQCNGTGGSQACSKCPTFNNRAARAKMIQRTQEQVLISCQNCGTVTTPLWRRDNEGNTICNACGLYLRMHHEHRPVKMVKNTIKRRKRAPDGEDVKSPPENDSPAPRTLSQGSQASQAAVTTPFMPQDAQVPVQYPRPIPVQPNFGPQMAMPIDFTTENNDKPAAKTDIPSYQPLSLLEYLSGDSKKEYLLAVRRQLQDKVSQIEIQLSEYVKQLSQCDEAIEKLN